MFLSSIFSSRRFALKCALISLLLCFLCFFACLAVHLHYFHFELYSKLYLFSSFYCSLFNSCVLQFRLFPLHTFYVKQCYFHLFRFRLIFQLEFLLTLLILLLIFLHFGLLLYLFPTISLSFGCRYYIFFGFSITFSGWTV